MLKEKGFTLIELMVVIVIIGILSALAIPRMFGLSNKAKASEVGPVASNFVTLEQAYIQETGAAGTFAEIGIDVPASKWWSYTEGATGRLDIDLLGTLGGCQSGTELTVNASGVASANQNPCANYLPNWPY